jgi:hypothetical protein
MLRDRRSGRRARCTDSSLTAQQQAVRDAEAIVCLAWAEELLRQHKCTAVILDAARQERRAASERLAAARRCGEPGRISLAQAMLQDATQAHRAGEAASERVHRALEAVLGALTRTRKEYVVAAAAARQMQKDVRPEPEAVRRALWRVGHLHARRAPGPGRL